MIGRAKQPTDHRVWYRLVQVFAPLVKGVFSEEIIINPRAGDIDLMP
jgi:hypothetical protein